MVARTPLQNLTRFDKLINPDGTPTDFFMRLLQNSNILSDETQAAVQTLETIVAAIEAFSIATTTPITGGPVAIGSAPGITIAHDASGVTAGAYGSASNVPVVTVDAKGHVTGISVVAISSSSYIPMVDGSVPPNLMYEADGSLILWEFTP